MPRKNISVMNERRELILDHALTTFAEKGFEKTTVDDIAKSAGISKGGVYVHFRSKDEIFFGIARRVTEFRLALMESLKEVDSFEKRLIKYLQTILGSYLKKENSRRIRFSFEFWVKSRLSCSEADDEKRRFNDERFISVFTDFENLLKAGVKAGEFKKNLDTKSLVYILMATIDGMALFTGVMDKTYTDRTINTLVDMVLINIKEVSNNG